MRTSHLSLGLLLAVAAMSGLRAAVPTNMQQASPIPLVPDGQALATRFVRLDPALDHIVSGNEKVIVTKGENYFGVIEGAAWVPDGRSGYLLFSDFPTNAIYRWDPPARQLSVYLTKSGFTGNMVDFNGHLTTTLYGAAMYVSDLGANGIALDPQGRVVLCAHGDQQIVRLEKDGTRTVLADGYQGKRFNHPNEMVIRSDGTIYATDTVARGTGAEAMPKAAIYMIRDGAVTLVISSAGHGLAFSPDEKTLYVTNYGSQAIMRYDVQSDGTVDNGRVFIDMAGTTRGAPNGMAVDREGNVYAGGPLGLWVMNPGGKHIGTVPLPAIAANLVFGGPDLKTLYILDSRNLLQMRVKVPGMLAPARLSAASAQN